MSIPRRTKAGCLLVLLVLFSLGAGFMLGFIASKNLQKKKEDSAFWKQAAMKHLEKLKPDDAQRTKFETHTDKAVKELSDLRSQAIGDVWEIVERVSNDIGKELTPEQKDAFEKIRPRPPETKAK